MTLSSSVCVASRDSSGGAGRAVGFVCLVPACPVPRCFFLRFSANFVARKLILRVVSEGQLKQMNSRQHKQQDKKRYDKTESFFPLGRVVASSSAGIASQQSLSGELELTCSGSLKLDPGTI